MRPVAVRLLTVALLLAATAHAQPGPPGAASQCLRGEGVCLTPQACEQSGREVRFGDCGGARGKECCVQAAVKAHTTAVQAPLDDDDDVYFYAAVAAVSLTVVVAIALALLWVVWCRKRGRRQAMTSYGSPTSSKGASPAVKTRSEGSSTSAKSARDAVKAAPPPMDDAVVEVREEAVTPTSEYQVFTSQLFSKPHQQDASQMSAVADESLVELPPAWKPLPGVLLRVASCAASSVNGSADPRQVSPGSTPPPRYTTSHSHPVAATGHWDRAVVAPPGPAAPREKRHSAPNKSTHTVHDVPAEVFETIEGEDDDEFMECSFPLPAAAQRSNHSQLVTALLGMATASPAEPLAGRYLPTGELTNAGQALVAYARSGGDEGDELAIKFFLDDKAYAQEAAGYTDPFLSHFLPPLEEANDASGTSQCVLSASGFRFPPFLVLSRGVPLSMWLQEERDAAEVLAMVRAVAAMLEALHAKGLVLTDLCPSNLIWLPRRRQWRFLNVQGIVKAGDKRVPTNAAYAPPEAILAQQSGAPYAATHAADVWALGVTAFEALTELTVHSTNRSMTSSSFTGSQQLNPGLCALATGARKYPWECAVGQMPERWAWCAVRPALQACVSRNALKRPTATDLLHSLRPHAAAGSRPTSGAESPCATFGIWADGKKSSP